MLTAEGRKHQLRAKVGIRRANAQVNTFCGVLESQNRIGHVQAGAHLETQLACLEEMDQSVVGWQRRRSCGQTENEMRFLHRRDELVDALRQIVADLRTMIQQGAWRDSEKRT
mgnify:CR=1 FL=1